MMSDFPVCPAISPRLLYFSLYYEVPDHAFQLAAETWAPIMMADVGFNPHRDILHLKGVKTEGDFKREWKALFNYCQSGAVVIEGHLFTHASLPGKSGLEFATSPADKNDGTLTREEILALEPLTWHSSFGKLTLEGCNTGNTIVRGWCPAQAFAQRQQVTTEGQTGFAYFSATIPNWVRIKSDEDNNNAPVEADKVYLWAYRRKKNGIFGDGSRMPGQLYRP